MDDISKQISNLSQEQRDLLIRNLTQNKDQQKEIKKRDAVVLNKSRPFDLEKDQNFTATLSGIGALDIVHRVSPRGAPGPGQVEIEIYASALNFRDILIAIGLYPTTGIEMGSDCSGVIVRVGEGVEEFKVGDEVMAVSDKSTFSRFRTVLVTDVVKKPACLSFEEAASAPTVFLTAYHSLRNLACLSKGERILIHSAAGGVGLAAIQYAQQVGAEIIVTVGTAEKREYIRSLGIERILNSRSGDFADGCMDLTGGEGVDVVLNSLSGEAIPKGLSILRHFGRFLELGRLDFAQNSRIGLAPFDKGLTFFSVSLPLLTELRPIDGKNLFIDVMNGFERGLFRPLNMRIFTPSELTKAFQLMGEGNHIGKLVIRYKDQEVMVAPSASA